MISHLTLVSNLDNYPYDYSILLVKDNYSVVSSWPLNAHVLLYIILEHKNIDKWKILQPKGFYLKEYQFGDIIAKVGKSSLWQIHDPETLVQILISEIPGIYAYVTVENVQKFLSALGSLFFVYKNICTQKNLYIKD